ncbi:hypothetical protein [Tunturiibacter lichenicola]|uniref:hypothetical protein n=1 Tax=Tunturiibacter lichenicola TaxID=2051959 RepID=UPI003D9B8A83
MTQTAAMREFRLVLPQADPSNLSHVYRDEEALNLELEFEFEFEFEFEDKSILEMIFRVSFRSTINLLEDKDGNYHLRKRIEPKRRGE